MYIREGGGEQPFAGDLSTPSARLAEEPPFSSDTILHLCQHAFLEHVDTKLPPSHTPSIARGVVRENAKEAAVTVLERVIISLFPGYITQPGV